jgi:hypothetical protein
MEKLMKKKQKKDGTAGTLTASLSISNINPNDNPFEEITRWFKTKRLDRVACPNPIAWWGVGVFHDTDKVLVLMFTLASI